MCALVFLAGGLTGLSSAIRVEVTDPRLQYVGRFDWRDSAGPRCSWAGSSVRLAFFGTSLIALLKDSGPEDYFEVIVDGKPQPGMLSITRAQQRYPVVTGLPAGHHVVELFKRTEPLVGTTQLLGFEIEGARLLALPHRSQRRLLIIGDSISCGFGNEAADETQPFSPRTENNYLAYGSVAARELGAGCHCIAWSGRKMSPDNTMPEVYPRTLPDDPSSHWASAAWVPNAVVINLATNDFREGPPEQHRWVAAYLGFVRQLRAEFPKASIVVTLGPMLSDGWPPGQNQLSIARGYLREVVSRGRADGDHHLSFLEFPEQRAEDGYGASKHPSVKTHRRMAHALVEALRHQGFGS